MKKFAYIAMGFLLGIVCMTAGAAFADQVKSLVGKKVTGEYTIIVDGKKLSDKGAVIDNKANVPARALSESLGADVSVSGKTITITSESRGTDVIGTEETSTPSTTANKYIGGSKSSLEEARQVIVDKVLTPAVTGLEKVTNEYEEIKKSGQEDVSSLAKQKVDEYQKLVDNADAELKLIDEALLTAK